MRIFQIIGPLSNGLEYAKLIFAENEEDARKMYPFATEIHEIIVD